MGRSPVNLASLNVDGLIALRAQIDEQLEQRRRDLQQQLARLGTGGKASGGAGRGHAMKGLKVQPKYRGPDGETWAGRGAQPRWLVALLKQGHKIEEFTIGKAGGVKSANGKTALRGRKPGAARRGRPPKTAR